MTKVTLVPDSAVATIASQVAWERVVSDAFVAAAEGSFRTAPVLRVQAEGGGGSFKFAASPALVGAKLGSFWPANRDRGIDNHSATTLLLDPRTGYLETIIAARLLNRLRTAAGNAVATDLLARPDAKSLAVIGAGGQALYEVRAIAAVRPIERVRIGTRNPAHAKGLVEALRRDMADVEAVGLEEAVREADILTTVTSAREPVVLNSWIAPGTHISAMGADAVGKQELDPELFGRARLFSDLSTQSLEIGEFQHALPFENEIAQIGDVIRGLAPGRLNQEEITIFDSSGLAIQDLYVAEAALSLARAAQLTLEIDL